MKLKQSIFKCEKCGFKSFKNYRECPICGFEKQNQKEKKSKFRISFSKSLKNAYYFFSLVVLGLTAIAWANMPDDETVEIPTKVIIGILVVFFLMYVGRGVEAGGGE